LTEFFKEDIGNIAF